LTERTVKILHIITRLDVGGSAENTLLTAAGQQVMGNAVSIICGISDNPASDNETTAAAIGVTILRIPALRRPISPLNDLIASFRLYRHLRKNRYDLVHTHTSKAGIVGRIAARFAGVKCIVHTPHGHIFYGYFSRTITRIFIFAEWLTMRWTDALITLTQHEKDDYLKVGIGPAERIHPIFSGIDLGPFLSAGDERERLRAEFGLNESHFILGTVARLVEVKNHQLIVRAAHHLKQYQDSLRFLFVGDGELHQELQRMVADDGLEKMFIFAGWRRDIAALLSAFDVFVMVSRNEGMGRAFVEAQAAGLPVIGTAVGGVPEVLVEGETGFLVGPDDSEALASRISALYTDRASLGQMAAACRAWVNPRFSDAVMVSKIDAVYQQCFSRKGISLEN
jgi:glycosyltransferase involved in cell wall biosynthesis